MHLVVGLGNPGKRYEKTRHNVGFLAAARLCERWGIPAPHRAQFGSLVIDGAVKNERVVVACPQQFMNLSGQPVASLMGYYKLTPEKVVVIYDDMGLPFETIRCRKGGGHGGHNGLRDISQHIGGDYCRVRFGIGRPPDGWNTTDYVLGKWTDAEQARLPDLLDAACDAAEAILSEGVIAAMNRFNVREDGSPAGDESSTAPSSKPPRGSFPRGKPATNP